MNRPDSMMPRRFGTARFATRRITSLAPSPTLSSHLSKSRFQPGMRVLDIACGEGRNSVWLASLDARLWESTFRLSALGKGEKTGARRQVCRDLVRCRSP